MIKMRSFFSISLKIQHYGPIIYLFGSRLDRAITPLDTRRKKERVKRPIQRSQSEPAGFEPCPRGQKERKIEGGPYARYFQVVDRIRRMTLSLIAAALVGPPYRSIQPSRCFRVT